jgi:hypothetical protein
MLWAHDALAYDRAKKQWQALMPRDIVWSLDRPGPARGQAAIADGKTVYLFGGHPTLHWDGNRRHQRADFLGATKPPRGYLTRKDLERYLSLGR